MDKREIQSLSRRLTDNDWEAFYAGVETGFLDRKKRYIPVLLEGLLKSIGMQGDDRLYVLTTDKGRDLLAYMKEIRSQLTSFELEMIRGELDGEWGAAIGAVIEYLRGSGLYSGFSRTPLARAVLRVPETK